MPKHPVRTLLIAASAVVFLAGCGIVYRQPIYQGNLLEESNIQQLQEGMHKQQVLVLLGTPSIQDPFTPERWDYTSTQRLDRLGRTQTRNLTLWFEGDELARWEGDWFPEQDADIAKKARKQFGPNLARDRK